MACKRSPVRLRYSPHKAVPRAAFSVRGPWPSGDHCSVVRASRMACGKVTGPTPVFSTQGGPSGRLFRSRTLAFWGSLLRGQSVPHGVREGHRSGSGILHTRRSLGPPFPFAGLGLLGITAPWSERPAWRAGRSPVRLRYSPHKAVPRAAFSARTLAFWGSLLRGQSVPHGVREGHRSGSGILHTRRSQGPPFPFADLGLLGITAPWSERPARRAGRSPVRLRYSPHKAVPRAAFSVRGPWPSGDHCSVVRASRMACGKVTGPAPVFSTQGGPKGRLFRSRTLAFWGSLLRGQSVPHGVREGHRSGSGILHTRRSQGPPFPFTGLGLLGITAPWSERPARRAGRSPVRLRYSPHKAVPRAAFSVRGPWPSGDHCSVVRASRMACGKVTGPTPVFSAQGGPSGRLFRSRALAFWGSLLRGQSVPHGVREGHRSGSGILHTRRSLGPPFPFADLGLLGITAPWSERPARRAGRSPVRLRYSPHKAVPRAAFSVRGPWPSGDHCSVVRASRTACGKVTGPAPVFSTQGGPMGRLFRSGTAHPVHRQRSIRFCVPSCRALRR